ncbi:MAG: MarR family transcriptional regulator [Candidatus Aminicenantes bacterium]|nr:MAG: MarR family transcriptional regulator [Candidatus Aminicenantes bacterium]
MNEIKESSSKNIVGAIRRLVRLSYLDSRTMVKRYGITGPQSLVLKSLIESVEPLSSVMLSRRLNVSPANITGIIDRLEEKGLVKRLRKQSDRRTILIELTEKGIGFGQQLPDLIEKKLIKGLSDLDSNEIDGIYMAFNKVIQIIDGSSEETIEIDHY